MGEALGVVLTDVEQLLALLAAVVRPARGEVAELVPAGAIAQDAVVLVGDRLLLVPLDDARTPVENLASMPLADVTLPADWTKGSLKLSGEVYPSVMADVVTGLEGMLHEPYGCFEQTSSSN